MARGFAIWQIQCPLKEGSIVLMSTSGILPIGFGRSSHSRDNSLNVDREHRLVPLKRR